MYIEQWCDGNGNLGPCSCGDGPQGKGHWRLSRTVKLDDVLEAARKQWDEETPAQWQDCTECADKAKRAEKERDEARRVVEKAAAALGCPPDSLVASAHDVRTRYDTAMADVSSLEAGINAQDEVLTRRFNEQLARAQRLEAERNEARAEAKKYEELMWHYKAAFEYLKSPAKACLDERAEGNGGCGACSVCCGELRDKLEATERQADRFQRLLTEVRAASEIEPELGALIDKALVANPYAYTPVFSGPPPQTGLILPPVPKQTLTDPSQSKENKS
jgi:chromosome segregation ATPase